MSDEKRDEQIRNLEEEGDYAADYLEELLDIIDFGGDIEIDVENDRASIAIVGDEDDDSLERLVGDDGEVLDAIQELTRLAVQAHTGQRSRLMLDIAEFRADRKLELRDIAQEAITRVKTHGEAVKLEPMNPFERKVCHDVIAEAGLRSESAGVEPNRYVEVLPADDSEEDSE